MDQRNVLSTHAFRAVLVAAVLGLVGASIGSAPAAAQSGVRDQLTPALTWMTNPEARDPTQTIDAYLMVWAEDRGSGADLYGKRLFANGLSQGGPTQQGVAVIRDTGRLSDPPGERSEPDMVYSPQRQEMLLVWSEFTGEPNGWDIFSVRLSTAGYSKSAPKALFEGPGDQRHPDVALIDDDNSANDGDYMVVWDDNSRDLDEIWGRRVRANGIPKSDPYLIFAGESWNASDPTTSGSVVAWVDDRGDEMGGDDDLWAIRLRNGLVSGNDYRIAGSADDDFNPNFGSGALVWNTYDAASGTDIQGTQVYANERTRGPTIGIVVPAADQSWPVIANGLLVFSDNRSGGFDIYAMRTVNIRSRGREFAVHLDRP